MCVYVYINASPSAGCSEPTSKEVRGFREDLEGDGSYLKLWSNTRDELHFNGDVSTPSS